jgi:hypothetical protein
VKMSRKEQKRAEKKRTSFRAADTVSWRPPKATDISNKLAAPSAIEQYHQMCGRTQIILKATKGRNQSPLP